MNSPSSTAPLSSLPANWSVAPSASLPQRSNPSLSLSPSFPLFFEWGGRPIRLPPSVVNALPRGEN